MCVGGRVVECSQDLACQLFDWFSSSGYALRHTFGFIDNVWDGAGDQISAFLSEHGEKLTAMAGFGFATYKWWVYRERILYRRLEEYIRESDKRLGPTTTQMMDAFLRPGRAVAAQQPAFALELADILEKNSWRSFLGLAPITHQAERQFGKALVGIRKREETVLNAAHSLQRQKAEIHKLRGALAIASARQSTSKARASELDQQALNEFRNALLCSTHRRDVKAKECEALQHLRLGEYDLALDAYLMLERFADDLDDPKERALVRARAKRFQAQTTQALAEPAGSLNAWITLAVDSNENDGSSQSALELRRIQGPYAGWDALEQGEFHYLAAYIANRLAFTQREPFHLGLADSIYRGLLDKLPKRLVFLGKETRCLRAEAQAGLDRVILAKVGRYDREWLMLGDLDRAHEDAEGVGGTGGTEGVE